MPAPLIPTPWIGPPPDTGNLYLKGYGIGASSAEASARLLQAQAESNARMQMAQAQLQSEQERHAMEMEVRKQQIAQESRIEMQKAELSRAYQEAQVGISLGKLQETRKANELKQMGEIRRAQAMQGYQQAIANKVPFAQAMLQNPGMFSSAAGMAQLAKQAELPEGLKGTWVPRDPKTGQGGYYLDPKGVPHWAPKDTSIQSAIDSWESIRQNAYKELPSTRKDVKVATEQVIKRAESELASLKRQQSGEEEPKAPASREGWTQVGKFNIRLKGAGPATAPTAAPPRAVAPPAATRTAPPAVAPAPAAAAPAAVPRVPPLADEGIGMPERFVSAAARSDLGRGAKQVASSLAALLDLPLDTTLRKKVEKLFDDIAKYSETE